MPAFYVSYSFIFLKHYQVCVGNNEIGIFLVLRKWPFCRPTMLERPLNYAVRLFFQKITLE